MAGERKQQILQALALMLEHPQGEKITTAGLAAKLELSEAALYRHFASKAQMYEGLIGFIEESVFTLANQIIQSGGPPQEHAIKIVAMLLAFAEKNPGMCRILTGDALVHEDPRLQSRIDKIFDRLELTLKQCFRLADPSQAPQVAAAANLLLAFAIGRWQLYVRSGFKRVPTEHWETQAARLMR